MMERSEVQQNDTLCSRRSRYLIMEFTGEGGFGKVARAVDLITSQDVALKILKKETPSEREIMMLDALRALDPVKKNVVHFFEKFQDQGHTCLVFEKLDMNLFTLLEQRQWEHLTLNEIRPIAHQLLTALDGLKSLGMVHADLKLDNIMLVNHLSEPFRVKLIDFGLSFMSSEDKLGKKVQPAGSRAPEVSLGLPLSEAIDMWGLGCILFYLYLARRPFAKHCQYRAMKGIVEMLGQPADHLLHAGRFTEGFFKKNHKEDGPVWRMKVFLPMTPREYQRGTGVKPKKWMSPIKRLNELITLHPWIWRFAELEDRTAFVSLLKSLLHTDPEERITPARALTHPFLTMVHLLNQTDSLHVTDALDKMRVVGFDDSDGDLCTGGVAEEESSDEEAAAAPRPVDTDSAVQDGVGNGRHPIFYFFIFSVLYIFLTLQIKTELRVDGASEEESATPSANTTAAAGGLCSVAEDSAVGQHGADPADQTLTSDRSPPATVKKERLRDVKKFLDRVRSAMFRRKYSKHE
ncbi:homeodomain-interacting protein kinase 1-like isoform X1 [Scophthalmus maximus]|uniref:homeodomain-interacting protein kinase 1-like isoform X1 n=1 Tax=Scophthalmus maximus TaxID=52904 RepID=UPI001FA84E05|nr:homeodomain-interacting protein kinase 1-like isoform X1 [Scophthalmus maximus]XP_035472738.2 homeodomain-interacting protein kinase 1-like isoform X1 [Scophthalmus maximus]